MITINIKLNLEKCNSIDVITGVGCPFCYTERTENSGYAEDYFCSATNNRKIAGYVEWEREIPKVPSWCPFKI